MTWRGHLVSKKTPQRHTHTHTHTHNKNKQTTTTTTKTPHTKKKRRRKKRGASTVWLHHAVCNHGQPQVVATRDCKASCGLGFRLQEMPACPCRRGRRPGSGGDDGCGHVITTGPLSPSASLLSLLLSLFPLSLLVMVVVRVWLLS